MNGKDGLRERELKGQKRREETAPKLYRACEGDFSSIAVEVDSYVDGDCRNEKSRPNSRRGSCESRLLNKLCVRATFQQLGLRRACRACWVLTPVQIRRAWGR